MTMADASSSSPSSSIITITKKYDAFISFRGEDTRHNFTSHLCAALRRKKVDIYIDEDDLERGEEISPALLQAIDNSKIAVIIFSENYASSSWCLDELLQILRCRENNGQLEAVPIFYNIDPSCVRKQQGSYEIAFADHEKRFKDRVKLHAWRDALTKAANLSGWPSNEFRPESKLVEAVVEDIIRKLRTKSSSESVKDLVGINQRIEKIDSLLSIGSSDVRIIGIWGQGGIGKTTLASVIYSRLYSQYEGCCYLSNVREEWEKGSRKQGDLQNELLSELLDEKITTLNIPFVRLDFDMDRLHSKRVLIVLDDVSNHEQLEFLIGDRGWFGLGSRIIITTRDMRLLENRADATYRVEELSFDEAFHLFHLNASKKNSPIIKDKELSERVVKYARGIPLALEVLMGSLFSYKSKKKWESILADLKNSPDGRVQNVYRVSYDGLTEKHKELFLDIACFFKGEKRDFVTRVLDGCDFFDDTKIDDLVEKSLITISPKDELLMHDLIQETGREIVRQQSIKQPGKRSRLWIPHDVYHVFKNNKVSAMVEVILVDVSKIKELHLSPKMFKEASNLRLLKIYNSSNSKECKLYLPQDLQFLPDALRYLQWDEYPSKSLPTNFDSEQLVELIMPNSQVEKLWDGAQPLPSLKVINLSFCQHLKHMPDLSQAPNLEIIYLIKCTSLFLIPSHNFRNLYKLTHLYLDNCDKLRSLPDINRLRSLETLRLWDCWNLESVPEISENVSYLYLNETKVKELPASIGFLDKLAELRLQNCRFLKTLPASMFRLSSLEILYLSGCSSLEKIPDLPRNVRKLCLSETRIQDLPASIGLLGKLEYLELKSCTSLKSLPTSMSELDSLEELYLVGCSSLEQVLELPKNLFKLDLSGTAIEQVPSSIGALFNLVNLHLTDCKKLRTLPTSICKLKCLRYIYLQGCSKFDNFPEILEPLESLFSLVLSGTAIKELPSSIEKLVKLKSLLLKNCENLQFLPSSIYNLKIQSLDLSGCSQLTKLPPLRTVNGFSNLSRLHMYECNAFKLPDCLGCLSSLEELHLSAKFVDEIPTSIKQLSKLRSLYVNNWKNLRSIPELPYVCLLDAQGCTSLESVSSSRSALMKPFDPKRFEQNQKLLFLGCHNLDQNARDNIIADAKLRISSMAAHAAISESYIDYDACIFYPGNEILKFIDHQARGCSIDVMLPAKWRSSSCFGFLICFVVKFNEYHYSKKDFRCDFHLRTKYGESVKLETPLWTCYDNGIKGTQILNSDHVFLCFKYPSSWALACKEADDNNITEMSFHIYALDWQTGSPVLGKSCVIKSCGVRLLSLHDANEFRGLSSSNTEYCSSSCKEVDDAMSKWSEPREICSLGNEEKPNGSETCREIASGTFIYDTMRGANEEEVVIVPGSATVEIVPGSATEEEEEVEIVPGSATEVDEEEEEVEIVPGSATEVEEEEEEVEIVPGSATEVEEEEEEEEVERVPGSATEVEEYKQSGSGISELSKTAEKDEEDPKSIASCGCFLFLSHFKEICEGILGKKSASGREMQTGSHKAAEERLQELVETVQSLQSENIMLRDQNIQLSQYLQMLTLRSPLQLIAPPPPPFPMDTPDQSPENCFPPNSPMAVAGPPTQLQIMPDLNIQILHNYSQMVTPGHGFTGFQPSDRQVHQNRRIFLPQGISTHPLAQKSQLIWQQQGLSRTVMSRPN